MTGNEAGDALVQLAGVHTKLESPHDAASAWVEAGKAYLRIEHRSTSKMLHDVLAIRVCEAIQSVCQRDMVGAVASEYSSLPLIDRGSLGVAAGSRSVHRYGTPEHGRPTIESERTNHMWHQFPQAYASSHVICCMQDIGEVLDREGEKEAAVTFLEQAADLFTTENAKSEANKCNLKVG